MKTLQTIFNGLNSIAGTILSNQNQQNTNQALNQYNMHMLSTLKQQQNQNNMPLYIAMGIMFIGSIVLITKK